MKLNTVNQCPLPLNCFGPLIITTLQLRTLISFVSHRNKVKSMVVGLKAYEAIKYNFESFVILVPLTVVFNEAA